jgi:hypothetical protein
MHSNFPWKDFYFEIVRPIVKLAAIFFCFYATAFLTVVYLFHN